MKYYKTYKGNRADAKRRAYEGLCENWASPYKGKGRTSITRDVDTLWTLTRLYDPGFEKPAFQTYLGFCNLPHRFLVGLGYGIRQFRRTGGPRTIYWRKRVVKDRFSQQYEK